METKTKAKEEIEALEDFKIKKVCCHFGKDNELVQDLGTYDLRNLFDKLDSYGGINEEIVWMLREIQLNYADLYIIYLQEALDSVSSNNSSTKGEEPEWFIGPLTSVRYHLEFLNSLADQFERLKPVKG